MMVDNEIEIKPSHLEQRQQQQQQQHQQPRTLLSLSSAELSSSSSSSSSSSTTSSSQQQLLLSSSPSKINLKNRNNNNNNNNNYYNIWVLLFFLKPLYKSAKVVNLDLQSIKWKNHKAPPGTAYTPTEIEHVANVLTHGIWIIPAFFASLQLIWRSKSSNQMIVACIYGGALTLLFSISTIFHSVFYIKKNRKLKNALHRCDRAMIYIFIAGSYFPWLNLGAISHSSYTYTLRWCIWLLATIGITYQQIYHERFKCLETIFYIIMGLGPGSLFILNGYDFPGLSELKIGGFLYIIGICFFKSDGLIPCAHAIWHLFVVLAASVHYFAILKHLFPVHISSHGP